ncbi:unnamed protein product [Mytilus edulis]|uniref:Endonuclease/exonuclease/phosphatase domain-containing protein n=1 Tax=Mytilus edulis TaxID=6550 RepID=A0A8S3SNI5_MYTED|nr:unnamed protein product [Mytilus edulis]
MKYFTCVFFVSFLYWTTCKAANIRSAGIGSAASGTNSAVIFPAVNQSATTTRPATVGTHHNHYENKLNIGSSALGKNPVNFIDGDCRNIDNENITATNFVTFNTALATSVHFYEQRRNLIVDALLKSEGDVLCLNEVWYVDDLVMIQQALQSKFPHSFSAVHNDTAIIMEQQTLTKPPCFSITFQTVFKCFLTQCNTSSSRGDQAGCFLQKCNGARLLSEECLTCVLLSGTNTTDVLAKCVNPPPSRKFNAINLPGLALFSKLPLTQRKTQNLLHGVKRLVPRWVLSAELWYVEDLIQIQKALQGNFPHSFSIIHDDAAIIKDKHTLAQPPCASVIFRTTMKCFMTHCNTSRNLIEQAGCFLVTCNASRLLSVECLTCVIISGTHTANVIEKCANTSPSRQFNAFNLPGLALFSKLPLAHRNRQNLIPNVKRLVSRWVLSAEVEKVGRIGCTHFTALMPFSYVDPIVPPLFSSFEEENLNNTLQILDYFKFAKQYILMGDFNQSPLRANVTPTFSDNFNVLRENGLSDPYVDNGGLPTFGRGNPLSIFQDRNLILDHIFHKGFDYISSKRVFDKFIGVKGQSIPLSDHFEYLLHCN